MTLDCFKAYDVRGLVGETLDADIAYRIGRAFARVMLPGTVAIGRDNRESSPMLQEAVSSGLNDEGVDVLDIGLCGTEEVYFATDHFGAGGGMMITASHNPKEYNGIKMVGRGATPVSPASGLRKMHDLAEAGGFGPAAAARGGLRAADPRPAYVDRCLSFIDPSDLDPFLVLANAGNGAAGPTFDAIADALIAAGAPLGFARVFHEPDPTFPFGVPNPLLPLNQPITGESLRVRLADVGVAWDGDFDRCFLFDETGAFVPGECVVGLLAAAMLSRNPGCRIVHDSRAVWNTRRIVAEGGGEAVVSMTGHALVKEKMREVDAAYGGEMSAHHYFRDFMYCDSGMIPWLLVLALMSSEGQKLSRLVAEMRERHPSSGEINFRVADASAVAAAVEAHFAEDSTEIDRFDGLSMSFHGWRFNLRSSNTEPVMRLNVEALGDRDLLEDRVEEISEIICRHGDRLEFLS